MKPILLSLIAILTFTACEKEITVKLKDTEPKLVIEGTVYNDSIGTVQLTRNANFYEGNTFTTVENANVSILDNTTNITYVLPHLGQGMYSTTIKIGEVGHTYTLNVADGDKIYIAQSTMQIPTAIDSFSTVSAPFGDSRNKILNLYYQDAPGIKNYYLFASQMNSQKQLLPFADEDKFYDGRRTLTQIFIDYQDLETNYEQDTFKIYFSVVDKPIFQYFYALNQVAGSNGPPTTPANPTSNINNGAIGYFSAQNTQYLPVYLKK